MAASKVTNTIILDELKEIRKAQAETLERTVRLETKLDVVLKNSVDHETRLRGLEKLPLAGMDGRLTSLEQYKWTVMGVVGAITVAVNLAWHWVLTKFKA